MFSMIRPANAKHTGLQPTLKQEIIKFQKDEFSRDAAAGPLRELSIMLQSVRSMDFTPDATRSGRWNVPWEPWQGQPQSLELDWYEPARSHDEMFVPDFPDAKNTPGHLPTCFPT